MESEQHFEEKIIGSLKSLSDLMRNLLWQVCEPAGVSPIQASILGILLNGESTASQIAAQLKVTKPTISDSVKSLRGKQMLEEKLNPSDSRSKILILTEKGKELAEKLKNYPARIHDILLEMYLSEKATLSQSLDKLVENLREKGLLAQ